MAMMAASGVFNALAFAGAGYLFKSFDKNGYLAETKRKDLFMETLAKDKEKFFENEVKRKDRERELQDEIRQANYNMKDTSKAFAELQELQRFKQEEPKLEDYYQPSDEMEKYQIAAVTLSGTGIGLLLSMFV